MIGLDRSEEILEAASLVSQCSGAEVEYLLWSGGEDTPVCDVAFVLNMLHHCPDQEATLRHLHCTEAVFEINHSELELVSKYFEVKAIVQGREYPARPPRLIVYGRKL